MNRNRGGLYLPVLAPSPEGASSEASADLAVVPTHDVGGRCPVGLAGPSCGRFGTTVLQFARIAVEKPEESSAAPRIKSVLWGWCFASRRVRSASVEGEPSSSGASIGAGGFRVGPSATVGITRSFRILAGLF